MERNTPLAEEHMYIVELFLLSFLATVETCKYQY